MNEEKKVIVIGSGFGGLAIAIRLQARGYKVSIFEKNSMVGGHAYQLKTDGYTFDMGPSLITAPHIIQAVFQSAGKKMEDYLNLIPLDPFYRIYFHDGTYLDYSGNTEKMKSQMAQFDKKDAENYERFIEHTSKLYKAVITDGLGSKPFSDWATIFNFLPRAIKLSALYSAYALAKRYFRDPRHRFSFSFHPLFIGGSPFRSPSIYQMIPYLEKKEGVWFTNGGMYSLVQALLQVFQEIGGKIETSSEVQEIVVHNGRAIGVRLKDKFFKADAVVSNADFYHTYSNLIKPERRKKWSDKKLKRVDYSMSAFLLYLGVKKKYPQLLHHTLIVSERYKGLIKDIFDKKILPEDFSMYLHVPSRTDESMAPKGCESMYVLVPVANLHASTDWSVETKTFTNKVLKFLEEDFGLQDLRENIAFMETFTPLEFKELRNNHLGSAWGVEPKLTQTAIFRPQNRSEDVKRLYLVGTSTHPGAGVPGVLLTAETTEKVVISDLDFKANGKANKEEVVHHESAY
jgi:phytoene desaturase